MAVSALYYWIILYMVEHEPDPYGSSTIRSPNDIIRSVSATFWPDHVEVQDQRHPSNAENINDASMKNALIGQSWHIDAPYSSFTKRPCTALAWNIYTHAQRRSTESNHEYLISQQQWYMNKKVRSAELSTDMYYQASTHDWTIQLHGKIEDNILLHIYTIQWQN